MSPSLSLSKTGEGGGVGDAGGSGEAAVVGDGKGVGRGVGWQDGAGVGLGESEIGSRRIVLGF